MSEIPSKLQSFKQTWHVEQYRFTLFPSKSAKIAHEEWWPQLIGELPESQESQPRLGIYRYVGDYKDGKVLLGVEPTRIDWKYIQSSLTLINQETALPPLVEIDYPPTLGTFAATLDVFSELVIRWLGLDSCPLGQRLAFGVILLREVETRENGFEILSRYIRGLNFDSPDIRDFVYQINRPRHSQAISGLGINRLSKWSVAEMRLQRMAAQTRIPTDESLGTVARVELDINTSRDYVGEFTSTQAIQAYRELVELGIEIAEQGDIP